MAAGDSYKTLATLSAATAVATLDAIWGLISDNTAHDWTAFEEDDSGTRVACGLYKDFGSGATAIRRVVAWCGKAATATAPGFLTTDSATSGDIYFMVGKIAPADFAWAGWTNAAPLGTGGAGFTYRFVTPAAAASVKFELWLTDMDVWGRAEGSVATTARVCRGGAVAKDVPLANRSTTALTADADSRYTGGFVSGGTIGATWTTLNPTTGGVYGSHSAANGNGHYAILSGTSVIPVHSRFPFHVAPPVGASNVTVVPMYFYRFDSGNGVVGLDTTVCTNSTQNLATWAPGGTTTAHFIRRDSSAAGEGIIVSASELWTT